MPDAELVGLGLPLGAAEVLAAVLALAVVAVLAGALDAAVTVALAVAVAAVLPDEEVQPAKAAPAANETTANRAALMTRINVPS